MLKFTPVRVTLKLRLIESVRKLKTGVTHTHALLSASVSKGLKSYMQVVTKGRPNPYLLCHALKD